MRRAWLPVRAALRWALCGLYFFTVCPLLVLLALAIDPRRNDWPQRWMCRTVLRLAGAKFEVRFEPGFDPRRTCLFVSNHVNLFDAFVSYAAIPQFVRGLELESHFRIPVYGLMARRFGNIPVHKNSTPAQTKQMYRRTKRALDDGVSLVVFPEGGRTLDGRVGIFRPGAFRMAIQFGYPIAPMAIAGSFAFNRKSSWMLHPAKIVVHLHAPIETKGLSKADMGALRDRVRQIISGSLEASLARASCEP